MGTIASPHRTTDVAPGPARPARAQAGPSALGRLGMAVLIAATGVLVLMGIAGAVWWANLRVDHAGIDLGKAGRVRLSLGTGTGTVHLRGTDENRFDATFSYFIPEWKPITEMSASSDLATISVSEPSNNVSSGFFNDRYDWDLRLKKGVPVELAVGAGAAGLDLDLRGIEVTGANITNGAGDIRVDLSGPRQNSMSGTITSGAGRIVVVVPEEVGVKVRVATVAGDVRVNGLTGSGGAYANAVYGTAPVNIELTVTSPAGDIEITASK